MELKHLVIYAIAVLLINHVMFLYDNLSMKYIVIWPSFDEKEYPFTYALY